MGRRKFGMAGRFFVEFRKARRTRTDIVFEASVKILSVISTIYLAKYICGVPRANIGGRYGNGSVFKYHKAFSIYLKIPENSGNFGGKCLSVKN